MIDLLLLSKDIPVAKVIDNTLVIIDASRLPLFLTRTRDIISWLESRAIDEHRVNSRLLKRVLRLQNKDDLTTVLAMNAATITDNYWVKPLDDNYTKYCDIRFTENMFSDLALKGDVNSFSQTPSRTPELTNIGSFEKCWRLEDGSWWMYKAGNQKELFSELYAYKIGLALGLSMAKYEAAGKYIKTKDFTENAKVNFEPVVSLIGDKTNYIEIYEILKEVDENIANAYVKMCYFDALILNMDRHEFNFGILRNSDTGGILSLAPLFDHNISMISRGYPKGNPNDILISDFTELLHYIGKPVKIGSLNQSRFIDITREIPYKLPIEDNIVNPCVFTADYLYQRQKVLKEQNKELLQFIKPKVKEI